ncbi:hypothetical protein IWX78_002790 [Mycetocola sp. CAN_C7]|uniref:hypothetical protein n=1 Tax=Mycetocola sp. CAN_C7 TaxID=2787724 RepID=UPI0018CB1A1C
MALTLVLLPSPLLGPAVWSAVGGRLIANGWDVVSPPPFGRIDSPLDVLTTWLRALPPDRTYVLVPHSNAGLFIPALTERLRVSATVFVDAALPPATGFVPLAPPKLVRHLEHLADSTGLLPAWTDWWDESELTGLFPSVAVRSLVEAEQQRLPLSYFTGRMPVADGWDQVPSAYLAIGDTYAAERDGATERDWPVTTLPGGHLHMLTAPDDVASALEGLLSRLGLPR